jgi:hypothetical protein
MENTISFWHLLWIIPITGSLGFVYAAFIFSGKDKDKENACVRCWNKWKFRIQPEKPGIKELQHVDESF